jgi:hypothetical protein
LNKVLRKTLRPSWYGSHNGNKKYKDFRVGCLIQQKVKEKISSIDGHAPIQGSFNSYSYQADIPKNKTRMALRVELPCKFNAQSIQTYEKVQGNNCEKAGP